MAFQEQNVALNIIHSQLILYNAYGHGTILPQDWTDASRNQFHIPLDHWQRPNI